MSPLLAYVQRPYSLLMSARGRDCRARPHVLLRHRLPPFRGEAFGVSAGLVDVGFGVVGETGDQAINPYRHPPLALLHVAANADGPALLGDDCEHHAVAEMDRLLSHPRHLLVGAPPVFGEPSDRCSSPPRAANRSRPVRHGIGSVESHQCIDVAPAGSREGTAHKLDQVGGRGLLGHRPSSIPRSRNLPPASEWPARHQPSGAAGANAGPRDSRRLAPALTPALTLPPTLFWCRADGSRSAVPPRSRAS